MDTYTLWAASGGHKIVGARQVISLHVVAAVSGHNNAWGTVVMGA